MSEPNQDEAKKTPKKPYHWLRRLLRVMAFLLLLIVVLLLFIRSPWGQNIIKDKLLSYVSDKTQTTIELEKLFITFEGNLQVEGLYLEDKTGDTLVYSKRLEANVPLWKTITGDAYGLDNLKWEGLKANISREDSLSGFNFQFLIDAFASAEEKPKAKKETQKPVNLTLGEINLTDFNISYVDKVTNIDSRFKIGQLHLEMKTIDLKNMVFETEELALGNTDIKFHLTSTSASDMSDSSSVLPKLSVGQLRLKEVKTDIQILNLIVKNHLVDFYTEIPKIDLTNEEFVVNTIQLRNSEVFVNINEDNTSNTSSENSTFKWPKQQVEIPEVILENTHVKYTVNQAKPVRNKFNPNAVELQNFNLKLEEVLLQENLAVVTINQFNFESYSGFQLKTLVGNFNINDQQILVDALDLSLNRNRLTGMAELKFSDLQNFIDKPEDARFNSNISTLNLSIKDLFRFQPELAENPYLKTISEDLLKVRFKASGTLSNLSIPDFRMKWGDHSRITTTASIQNITDVDAMHFGIPRYSISTKRTDIIRFVDESQIGICLPDRLQLTGQLNGNIKNISTRSSLESSQGIVSVEGQFSNDKGINFDSTLNVEDYRLDELVDNTQLGKLSLELSSKGSVQNINAIDADIDLVVSAFDFNDYTYEDLNFKGFIKDGEGEFVSDYKDDNLNFNVNTSVELDSVKTRATANLSLKGVDLIELGFIQRDIKTAFELTADFSKINETYSLETKMKEGVIVYNNESYLIGAFDTSAIISDDTTQVDIDSRILKFNLKTNSNPQRFSQAISDHINGYFYENENKTDSINSPVKAQISGTINQSPVLNEVFLVNLKDIDTINLALDFDEKRKHLDTSIGAPHINYAGNEIDSFKFAFNSDHKIFNFNFGFDGIETGPLNIPKTRISGKKNDEELSLVFEAIHNDEPLVYALSKLKFGENRLKFSLDHDSLIINSKRWTIPQNNSAVFGNDTLVFNNFNINRNDQSIEIADKSSTQKKPQIALDFKNFKLSQFLNYLNPDSEIANGRINGMFVLENPFTNTGIIADISVSQLEVLKANFGTLNLNANSTQTNSYDFKASLKEGEIDLDFNGSYLASEQESKVNMHLDINKFQVKAFNQLALGEIKEGKGIFSGQVDLEGKTQNPTYQGEFKFKNAGFKVTKLNTNFILKDETLRFDNDGLSLNNFTVRDAEGNQLLITGEIGTESFINPTFDLKLNANDFKILDANKGDNDLFYGKAIFDAKAKLTGDLQVPQLDAELKVDSKTDFVYILPASTASIQKRDGIVNFVNRENPDAILSNDDVQNAKITGFDITSKLKVNKEARFKIIIDQDSGDNFQVQGEANLNFRMFPNGRINLSGIFEATNGHYDLSLYNLVKRKFILAPGSKVIWNGDPFNAKLDVKAIYNVEASASSLMAAQISGLDPAAKSKYRQVLPFEVYLNIENELLQPEISFRLDMPDEEKDAIGGQVYSKIQQVNQQKAELNQQVFSLLVLNRFYPNPGSDGSSGGIRTLAQDNINDAIAKQLNAYSDKILGNSGIDLDFGLDSYTDYQGDSPTERTQLNVAAEKKLFNDRLTVRVGSDIDVQGSSPRDENTPILGNVSLVYELTKDGRYKLKGFTKNNFENVIDGQTVVSGIALIFTQEFNKFRELWEAIFRRSNDEKNAEDSNEGKPASNKNEKE